MNRTGLLRLLLLGLLLCLTAAGVVYLFGTAQGRALRNWDELRHVGHQFHHWVHAHPVTAPLLFIALYVLLAVSSLPVWWLQILAGFGWGLLIGVFWCVAGGTLGAFVTVAFGHWLGGDWIHARAGKRLHRVQQLSEAVGHNGLFVVLICRLCHGIPFGLSNYLFGLIGVTPGEAALGTAIGLIPVSAAYAIVGSHPHLMRNWRFWTAVAGLNLALMIPLVVIWFVRRRRAQSSGNDRPLVQTPKRNPQMSR